jgi:hypothetical protein
VPKNHTLEPHPLFADEAPTLDAADLGCGAQASIAVADGSAPTGRAELLPFLRRSLSAVELCRGIVDGSATSIPVMHVSEALAILVYRLVIDDRTRAEELSTYVWGDVYAILASLSLGQRVTSDSAAGQKLNKLITRKASPSRPPGLDGALRLRAKGRGKDNKLKDMTHEQAERHLLLMWDEFPLQFDFGGGAAGGGAADGGAGASPAALDTPDPEELPLADLDDAMEALLATLRAAASDEGESAPPADDNMEDAAAAALTTPAVLARNQTYEQQAISLRATVDQQRRYIEELCAQRLRADATATRALRKLQQERDLHQAKMEVATAATGEETAQAAYDLLAQRAKWAAERKKLLSDGRLERIAAEERAVQLEEAGTALKQEVARLRLAARKGVRESEVAVETAESKAVAAAAEVLHVTATGRSWALMREQTARAGRAEAELETALDLVANLKEELATRNRGRANEHEQLNYFRRRTEELQAKLEQHHSRSNTGFAELEPLVEENEALRIALDKARAEAAKYRAVAEPDKSHFKTNGAFSLAVDLAIAECLTRANVSRNKVPELFVVFARFFGVKLPTHTRKVPLEKVNGKMIYVERELLYVPGRTHVKEVCATLNQVHKLQIGSELLEAGDAKYCYIADGGESLQIDYLAQLLSRRDAAGEGVPPPVSRLRSQKQNSLLGRPPPSQAISMSPRSTCPPCTARRPRRSSRPSRSRSSRSPRCARTPASPRTCRRSSPASSRRLR